MNALSEISLFTLFFCALVLLVLAAALFLRNDSGPSSIIPPRWMWPKTKKDAWIDVKDRMPKAGQRALLRLNNGDAVDVGTWYGASTTERAGWHDDTGDFYFVGVTHWQPLPTKERKR